MEIEECQELGERLLGIVRQEGKLPERVQYGAAVKRKTAAWEILKRH